MLRATALAFVAATMLGTSGVSAQTIDLGGRGGPSIDLRNDRQRERDIRRDERARERERDRTTGSVGRCREITVRERDESGRMVTRRTEECR